MMSDPVARCQYCRHWRPLFSGEHWGVRSFADAPAEERERIFAALQRHRETDGDPYELPDNVSACLPLTDGYVTGYPPRGMGMDVLGVLGSGDDWPMWGECELTEMNEEKTMSSLARAMDGSEYYAILRCHASFGCIQWVAITAEEDQKPDIRATR